MVKNESEEVGLLDLIAGAFSTLKRNLVLTILLPLIGAASGAFYYLSSSSTWESSMLMETSLLSIQEGKFLFGQLEKIKLLPGLTMEQQRKIKRLSYDVLGQNEKLNGLNESAIYLQVTAQVFDEQIFGDLQQALFNIVNTSAPITRHREERSTYYNQVIAKIDEEINAMEKVKAQVSGQTQATFLNPSSLYAQTVDLFREKMTLQIRKEEVSTVHLIKGFDTLSFDRRISLVISVAVGVILGFLALIVVLFLKFIISYLKVYESTH